jgi:hypothetical protein
MAKFGSVTGMGAKASCLDMAGSGPAGFRRGNAKADTNNPQRTFRTKPFFLLVDSPGEGCPDILITRKGSRRSIVAPSNKSGTHWGRAAGQRMQDCSVLRTLEMNAVAITMIV